MACDRHRRRWQVPAFLAIQSYRYGFRSRSDSFHSLSSRSSSSSSSNSDRNRSHSLDRHQIDCRDTTRTRSRHRSKDRSVSRKRDKSRNWTRSRSRRKKNKSHRKHLRNGRRSQSRGHSRRSRSHSWGHSRRSRSHSRGHSRSSRSCERRHVRHSRNGRRSHSRGLSRRSRSHSRGHSRRSRSHSRGHSRRSKSHIRGHSRSSRSCERRHLRCSQSRSQKKHHDCRSRSRSSHHHYSSHKRSWDMTPLRDNVDTSMDKIKNVIGNEEQQEASSVPSPNTDNACQSTPKTWTDCNIGTCLADEGVLWSVLKRRQPTEFQIRVLESIRTGRDVLAIAEKCNEQDDTFAFVLPLFKEIKEFIGSREAPCESPLALIIAPTSRRTSEIASHCELLTDILGRDQICLSGETCLMSQKQELTLGCDFIVSTPGRLIEMTELMQNCSDFTLRTVKYVVIVDADISCQMGLVQQIRIILDQAGPLKQVVLTSSTYSKSVSDTADKLLSSPLKVPGGFSSLTEINQEVSVLEDDGAKLDALLKVLTDTASGGFARGAQAILVDDEESAQSLIGELEKHSIRSHILDSGDCQLQIDPGNPKEVASSEILIIARSKSLAGVDVPMISLVINYQCPSDFVSYITSCRLLRWLESESCVHTFLTKDQGRLSGNIIIALMCSRAPVPRDLEELGDAYRVLT